MGFYQDKYNQYLNQLLKEETMEFYQDKYNQYLNQLLGDQFAATLNVTNPIPPGNYGAYNGGSTAPPKLTPAQRLQKLQEWFGDGTAFHWVNGPTPLKRGVFPTWLHVKSWYDGVLSYGYTIEDIGFSWEELHPIWAKYARETFPATYANYNKLYPNDYPME